MKKRKILIISGILMLVLVAAYYFYFGFLYKDARNIESEQPAYTITAETLVKDYETDRVKANSKYLNKTIVVLGNVNESDSTTLALTGGVSCSFDKALAAKTGEKIKVKGRCIGFDELFGEVKLDQCTINQ